jgi:hypothetical protein
VGKKSKSRYLLELMFVLIVDTQIVEIETPL